jgi:hypothetical protein
MVERTEHASYIAAAAETSLRTLLSTAPAADDPGVQVIVLGIVLAGSMLLALGVSRLVLGAVIAGMTADVPFGGVLGHRRRLAAVAALFVLAYLVPALASSETLQPTVAHIFRLLRP